MLLFIIFFLLNILYIIFGYTITLMSVMIYDSPNSRGFYTDFFFYSLASTIFFAVGSFGSFGSFIFTCGYEISINLLLINLFLIGISSIMISYFQDGSFVPKNKHK